MRDVLPNIIKYMLALLFVHPNLFFMFVFHIHSLLYKVKQVSPNSSPIPGVSGYAIIPCTNPNVCETFFPGRRASILLSVKGGEFMEVGCFGVLHPMVLTKERYDMEFPCSAVEMNLEPFV
jgi:phenylalanyl-tRNA synthetase beta chain